MQQSREPIFAPDAGKIVGRAVDLTQAALASDAGKAVRQAIAKGPEGLMQQLSQATDMHDPVVKARVLLAEQSENFDVMRSAIGRIGESLAHVNAVEPGSSSHHPHTELLNAQAEAIQGLTLLVLKGQQVQAELINAVGDRNARAQGSGMPKWIYYMMAATIAWSMLGMIF